MKKLIYLFVLVILTNGCVTTQNVVPGSNQYCDQYVETISDPPGAKIEINNQYMGETPLTVRLTRKTNYDWWNSSLVGGAAAVQIEASPFTINAYPDQAGQFTQKKYIGPNDVIPNKIYFNMNLGPITPSVNVNVNQQ